MPASISKSGGVCQSAGRGPKERIRKLDLLSRCGCSGDLRLPKKTCGLFGRRWTDVKTRSPLKSRHFGQLGYDLEVPMIVVIDFLAHRRGVQHEIVRGTIEHGVYTRQSVLEPARED